MIFLRAATVALEIAHHGADGRLHGHTLLVQAWTGHDTCLDAWQALLRERTAHIEGVLEQTIGARTFEDVAVEILRVLPEAVRVAIQLPSRGHSVDVSRGG